MKLFQLIAYFPCISALSTLILNSLGPNDNYFLTAKIQIGSNKQNFTVELDTGSSELWVTSNSCKVKKVTCSGDHFTPSQSTSFTNLNLPFEINYDDGTFFQGNYVNDTIFVSDLSYNSFTLGLVDKAKYPPEDKDFNIGIIGLTPVFNGEISSSLLQNMFYDTTLPNKVFSLYLPKQLANLGEMTIGGTNPSLYINDTKWIPVKFQDFAWNMGMSHFEDVNGVSISSSFTTIIDTGSDVIYGPEKAIKPLCKSLGMTYKKGDCYTSCSKVKSIKNFFINVGNVKLLINVQNYFTSDYGGGDCGLSVYGDKAETYLTLGMAVVRQYYTMWNFDDFPNFKGKIGFATPI
jgi:hypothetical protein